MSCAEIEGAMATWMSHRAYREPAHACCGEKLGPRIRGMRACAVGGSCLRLSLGLWWFELDIVEVAIIDEVVAMGILGEDVA